MLRQESKQRSRLKGGATRSRSNCSPLENPPGGTIGRLTLRFGSGAEFQPLPPFWVVVFGVPCSHAVDWKMEKAQYRTIERYRAGQGSNDYRPARCEIVSGHCPQGSLAKGSWHAGGVTEGFYSKHFPKAQTYVETCLPAESPRFGFAKPPPQWPGGLCPKHLLHRSNDTGRVRERTIRRKLPCEIDTGGTPAGTGGAVTICRRLPCEIATGGTQACEIVRGHCPLR